MNCRCTLTFICALISISLHVFADSFTWTGGSLEGGSVLCVTQDPVVPEVLYAGTWAGLYRSTDEGGQWSPVDLPFSDPIFSLAWDQQQSRLFAGGTGRIFVGERAVANWSPLELPADGAPISAILFEPDSPMRVFAGTAGRGLFRSDDGGQTWAALGPGAGEPGQRWALSVTDLAYDPVSHIVYVATQGGLFKNAATGLRQVGETTTSALVFRPKDSRIYAASGNQLRSGYVESTLWGPLFAWRETPATGTVPNSILDLCVDPHDPSMLWAGTESGVYQGRFKTDPGTGKETIVWTNSGDFETAIGSIACAADGTGTVFAAGISGFWTTSNGGDDWRGSSSGIRASRFLDVIPVPGRPGILFGAVVESLLYGHEPRIRALRSDDWGTTWRLVLEAQYGGVKPSLAIDPGGRGIPSLSPMTIYLEGKRKSTDLGETWTTDIPFAHPGTVSNFYMDPGKPDNQALSMYYHGAIGFYTFTRITSNGWGNMRERRGEVGLPRNDPHSPYSLYFAGSSAIYHWDGSSNDATPVVSLAAGDLEPDRFVPGRLYVVSNGRLYVYPGTGNQAEVAGLPPETRVLTVRCHVSQPGIVAAGTSDGLHRSHDYGASWEKVTARGLNTGQVFGVSFDPEDASVVYLAAARGAFRLRFVSNIEHRRRPRAFDGGIE